MKVPIQFIQDIFTAEKMRDPASYEGGNYYRKELPAAGVEWNRREEGKISSLKYICPCGCGAVGHVTVSLGAQQSQTWGWDGNEEKPTLTPSIQMLTKCRWHGFLVKGEFVNC